MAEEKKVDKKPEASKTEHSQNKFLSWIKAIPTRIVKLFTNMWSELKRVTWPTKRKLIVYSVVVLVFMLCMGIVVGLFDMGASALVKLLGPVKG